MPLFDFLKSDNANFFQWFEDATSNMLNASRVLRELCYNYQNPEEAVSRLHDLEHLGDEIGHEMYNKLNNTFVTPMDREDIISLYSAIDDVTDLIHSVADLMVVYRVEAVTPIAQQLSDCIVSSAEHVAAAVPHLRKRSELSTILPSIVEIHSLENQADQLLRDGLSELFSTPQDVLHIIRWRDIYAEMEEATDKAEDIADVLRGLVIKNA